MLAVNQVLILVCFWLGVILNKNIIWSVYGLILLVLILYKYWSGKLWLKSDLIPGLLFLITILSFVPSLWVYNHSLRIPIISHGVDPVAHFSMFSKMVESGEILYKGNFFDNFKPLSPWILYPSGFYGNVAVTYLAFVSPFVDNPGDAVYLTSFFSGYMICIYALMIFWFGQLVMAVSNKNNIFLFLGLFLLSEKQIYGLFNFGFMAQILSYLWIIVLVLVTINKSKFKHDWQYWVILLVINMCISNSWYVVSLFALAWLLVESIKLRFYKKWWFYVLSIIFLYPTLFPVFMSFSPYGGGNEITVGGGIMPISAVLLIFLSILNAVYKNKGVVNSRYLIVLRAIKISTGYSLIIGVYQILVIGSVSYYFYKSLYLLLIFLVAGGFLVINDLLQNRQIVYRCNWLLWLLALFIAGLAIRSQNGEGLSFFIKREPFLDRDIYNGLMVMKEERLSEQYSIVPFGSFKNIVWFYAYMGYLPKFYQDIYPQIEFFQYPWIFEQVKNLKLDKPLMIFDAFTYNMQFKDDQKEYVRQNGIIVYPEGAVK